MMRLFPRTLLLLLSLFLTTGCFKLSREIGEHQTVERGGLRYAINEQTPYTGKVVVRYSNRHDSRTSVRNQKKSEQTYKYGKLHGTWVEWFQDGKMSQLRTFKDGKLHGKRILWRDGMTINYTFKTIKTRQGRKAFELTYKNGKEDGKLTEWHSNGQKKAETTYRDGGIITEHSWDENGNEL